MSYDANPKNSWWNWPDPAIVANNYQRLYTKENAALDLDDFTVVTVLRSPVGTTPSTRAPAFASYSFSNDGFYRERSWRMENYAGNWQGWISNDGATPLEILKCTGVGSGQADEDFMMGMGYHFNNPGSDSDGFLYWNQPTTGKKTDTSTIMEGPPGSTTYPLNILGVGWTTWKTRCWWGQSYWWALYTRKLSETEFDNLYSGATMPYDVSDIGLYIDFSQMPAATITPNIDNLSLGDLYVHNWANITADSDSTADVSILGHEFGVAVSEVSVLGHDFAVELGISGALGHKFTVLPRRKLLSDISRITRRRLG